MKRHLVTLLAIAAAVFGLTAGLSQWIAPAPSETMEDEAQTPRPEPGETPEAFAARQEAEHNAMLDRDYPMHGLVSGAQLRVHAEADRETQILGWLRLGGRIRLKREPRIVNGCASGWYEVYPRGWVCTGLGVAVSEAPPETPASDNAANANATLPYRYLQVREPQVPEYHRLPSRNEQRAARAHAQRYVELLNSDRERQAERLRAGTLANEPRSPAVVSRYLQRNFFIASNATEIRSRRRFVRTVQGSYVKEAQLIPRTGSDYRGIELGEERQLPIAWAVRASRPLERRVRADGTIRFVPIAEAPPFERHDQVPWLRRERHGTQQFHVLEDDVFLRDWWVVVAERRDPPDDIAEDEPWVHVDRGEQTLVLYRGHEPIYATLISTGLDAHETPLGEFRIRRKFISDTMANIGPDVGDDSYRIEDVPWTQYFDGSIALHGAFWHNRFGLQRSHGCVNLAPAAARFLFEHTWPEIPEGWHGVSTERTGFVGSRVIVTE